jgi:hypothetical protein
MYWTPYCNQLPFKYRYFIYAICLIPTAPNSLPYILEAVRG